MLREILRLAHESEYDFRLTACPDDPLQYLFEEWVPYYRMKWAIARFLQPARILELGVRYGYSALTFLNACPSAEYIGIDIDSASYGGTPGAIEWARSHAQGYNADFLIADSQQFTRFPGGAFDLIHIDGQQDEKGFLHDIEVAIGQGSYVLVDGYFWTRENFLSASEFLFRNSHWIEFYGVIPGYAGDLLIARKEGLGFQGQKIESSAPIREAYDSSYYLCDCGGFDSFKRTGGVRLEDPRLRTVAELAALAPRRRALDLGCGRGELSVALARYGFDVTAVDYSPDAIAIANTAKAGADDPSLKISFHCEDLNRVPLEGNYDAVVAADVVEHLSPGELDSLYERIASHLAEDGLFVVHTFPNSWYYRYEYARRMRIARSVGAYLPLNPRSRHEALMHINEQSPRILRRQLLRYFPHVLLWFSGHDVAQPYENLRRRFSIHEMRSSGDLFAIASNRPTDPAAIVREFRMEAIAGLSAGDVTVRILQSAAVVHSGSRFTVDVLIGNRSGTCLKSCPPHPVHLSYHWLNAATRLPTVFDGERTRLDPPLSGQSERQYKVTVCAPSERGTTRLRITLVQETIGWLDGPPVNACSDTLVEII